MIGAKQRNNGRALLAVIIRRLMGKKNLNSTFFIHQSSRLASDGNLAIDKHQHRFFLQIRQFSAVISGCKLVHGALESNFKSLFSAMCGRQKLLSSVDSPNDDK